MGPLWLGEPPRCTPTMKASSSINAHSITSRPWWQRADTAWVCFVLWATSDLGGLGWVLSQAGGWRQPWWPGPGRVPWQGCLQSPCAASGHGNMSWNSTEMQSKDTHGTQKDIPIISGSRNEWCLPMLELGSWKRCRHHLHTSNLTAIQFRKKLT